MAIVMRINIHDLNAQFFSDFSQKIPELTEVEICLPENVIFSDDDFWQVIDLLDWSQEEAEAVMAPAIQHLASLPVFNIYLFSDQMAEKLYALDTRKHGFSYTDDLADGEFSVDGFLYSRCAVVAGGKDIYEEILENHLEFPSNQHFEPLLNLANQAYLRKTGRVFQYRPTFNYETYSNEKAWN